MINFKYIIIGVIVFIFSVIMGIVFFNKFHPDNDVTPIINMVKNKSNSKAFSEAADIYQHNLIPIASNQWYSNVYKKFPTQPIFSLPLAFRLTPNGISFSYPEVNAVEKTVFSVFSEDFIVGLSEKFEKPSIKSISDWSIKLSMTTNKNNSIVFTLAHGIPFVNFDIESENILINFTKEFDIFDQNKQKITSPSFISDSFTIVTNKHIYIFAFPNKSNISLGKHSISIEKPDSLFIALMDNRNRYEDFKKISEIEILGTKAEHSITGNNLINTFTIDTNGKVPLVALLPHQADYLSENIETLGVYPTLRGDMKLIRANKFIGDVRLVRPDEKFKTLKKSDPEIVTQLKKNVRSVINAGVPNTKNYFFGTWLGKIASLIQISDSLGEEQEKEKLVRFLEPVFTNSLTFFQYDEKQKSIVSKFPEFGNESLNDHHFHYGYFIRTAAILAKNNHALIDKYKGIVGELVNDIANHDRNSENYPYLRNFDVFEGHSWADGYADFADGNNQESTSEAINAWYGIYLWSKVIKNPELQDYALYLYNSEIISAFYYWFDIKDIYPKQYSHNLASIVWGGKADFSTWFSKETNMIYGIQLLPITPASNYLGKLPDFSKYEKDFIENDGDVTKEWGDLFVIWKSFYNPEEAFGLKEKILKPHGETPRSLFLYMLYLNKEAK